MPDSAIRPAWHGSCVTDSKFESSERQRAGIRKEGTGDGTGNGDGLSGGARSSPVAPRGAGRVLAVVIEAARDAARVGTVLPQAPFRCTRNSDARPRDEAGPSTQDRIARTSNDAARRPRGSRSGRAFRPCPLGCTLASDHLPRPSVGLQDLTLVPL